MGNTLLRILGFCSVSSACWLLVGGNASLTLENIEEPYLGGVRFTAMPPMKRFRYGIAKLVC